LARNESDAAALQAKLAAKKAAKEAQGEGTTAATAAPVPRKKAPTKKADNMDDLLSAGLPSGKKK
jgi:hypothetical protein